MTPNADYPPRASHLPRPAPADSLARGGVSAAPAPFRTSERVAVRVNILAGSVNQKFADFRRARRPKRPTCQQIDSVGLVRIIASHDTQNTKLRQNHLYFAGESDYDRAVEQKAFVEGKLPERRVPKYRS